MIGFLSKIFGGSKSDKDVKRIQPVVAEVNKFYDQYQTLTNDQLRDKTQEFRSRIQEHLKDIDSQILIKKRNPKSVMPMISSPVRLFITK